MNNNTCFLVYLILCFVSCLLAHNNRGNHAWHSEHHRHDGENHRHQRQHTNDEYFDTYVEIKTRYSQVHWTRSETTPLPDDIVNRFKNKVMAVTGYEVDQVVKSADGVERLHPYHHSYNRHYSAWLLGKDSEMVELEASPNHLTKWGVKDRPHSHKFPTNIVFEDNSGGEHLKDFHPSPAEKAWLIHSPSSFTAEPMQIDIRNREHKGPGYKPWFMPKSAGNWDRTKKLNPLIDCPCTDRISKKIVTQPTQLSSGVCSKPITSANDCFAQAKLHVPLSSTVSVNDKSLPYGCIVSPQSGSETYTATFNSAQSATPCGSVENLGAGVIRGSTTSLVDLTVQVDPTNSNVSIIIAGQDGVWFGVGFNADKMSAQPWTIVVDGTGGVTERKIGDHKAGTQLQNSVTVISNSVTSGVRTVALSRAIAGRTSDYYTFPTTPTSFDFINAIGKDATFGDHRHKAQAKLTLAPADVKSCICEPSKTSLISYNDNDLAVASEEIKMMDAEINNNLECCHHKWFLTDSHQESGIPSSEDTYYLKFRFYFKEFQ